MIGSIDTAVIEKDKAAANFNLAAGSYGSVSTLQDYVGTELLDRLQLIKLVPETVLDLGAGPGSFARALARKYSRAHILQLDIAERMLEMSRSCDKRFFSKQHYICADAESIPLADGAIDMVFSNLMLQWCHEPDKLFRDVARILVTEGLFIFSSFGPDTLRELRECWAAVDDKPHVHTFLDMHDLGDALIRSGFADPVIEVDYITLTYSEVKHLMQDLKQLGAENVSEGRRRTLTGKQRLLLMMEEYEKKRVKSGLPATYEVIYGHAWAAADKGNKPSADGVFQIPVDRLKESLKRFS